MSKNSKQNQNQVTKSSVTKVEVEKAATKEVSESSFSIEEKISELEDAIEASSSKIKRNNLRTKLAILYEQRDKADSETDSGDQE